MSDGRLTLGLPEVQLGIHPGFGGTVRSVQLVGVRAAMDMMLTGKNIRGDRALKMGLVDRLAPADGAEAACRELLQRAPAPHKPPFIERMLSWSIGRSFLTDALRRQVGSRVKREHYPAPFAIVDLWSKHGAQGRRAYEAEAQSIAQLFQTSTARNLVRVFQLQDQLKALGAKNATADAIRRVHVVGAGIMGGDIAAWCALRGFEVSLQDRTLEQVSPALERARTLFAKRIFDETAREQATRRLVADVEGKAVPDADLVIEAIFENADAKRALYAQLLPRMKPTALLATNTSSIMLETLTQGMDDPGRLVGLHFFNPVSQMPLVEIIQGQQTRAEVASAATAFVKRLDKLPLALSQRPRVPRESRVDPLHAGGHDRVEQGILPEIVDAAATGFGMPMGPIELADVVGLDTCHHVGEIIGAAIQRTPPVPMKRLEALLAAKQLGRKSGQGYYTWIDGKARKQKVAEDSVPADLTDRLMLTLVNESVACLREGVVASADLVDAGVIFGAGFAPFRGGPLNWARAEGPRHLLGRFERLTLQHGSRFAPDPGWSAL